LTVPLPGETREVGEDQNLVGDDKNGKKHSRPGGCQFGQKRGVWRLSRQQVQRKNAGEKPRKEESNSNLVLPKPKKHQHTQKKKKKTTLPRTF